jgi:tetratricopeptide (TPR) repeat protein
MASELPRGRRGTHRLIACEEEARRRLARELHDDHCQRLAALSFELKVARRDFTEGDPRRTGLEAVGASLAELGEDLRRQDLERALAIEERIFGTASPHLVETLANLAELHLQHGRYAEAEPLYQRLVKLREAGTAYDGWDKVLADYARLTARSR